MCLHMYLQISQGTKDIQHIFADDIIKSPSVCPLVRRSSRRLTDLSLSDELSVLSEPSDDLEDLSHLEECIKMDIGIYIPSSEHVWLSDVIAMYMYVYI